MGSRLIKSLYYNPQILQGLSNMWGHAEVYHIRESTFNTKFHEI